MKQKIINLLVSCDMQNSNVLSCKEMSPSSSIEEIAEYICNYFDKMGNKQNG